MVKICAKSEGSGVEVGGADANINFVQYWYNIKCVIKLNYGLLNH